MVQMAEGLLACGGPGGAGPAGRAEGWLLLSRGSSVPWGALNSAASELLTELLVKARWQVPSDPSDLTACELN